MKKYENLTPIISLSNDAEKAILTSILEDNNIHYVIENQNTQDLFGIGRFGGYNYITGPQRVFVPNENVVEAANLLRSIKQQESFETEETELHVLKKYNMYLNGAVIVGLILPGLNIFHLYKAIKIKYQSGYKLGGRFKLILSSILFIFGCYIVKEIII